MFYLYAYFYILMCTELTKKILVPNRGHKRTKV